MREWTDNILLIFLAAAAGFLGHIMRTIDRGGKIRWLVAGLEACSSAFVGYLAILMCSAMGLSYEWTGVIVGLFGWLGASVSVKVIEKVVRRKLGLNESNPFGKDKDG